MNPSLPLALDPYHIVLLRHMTDKHHTVLKPTTNRLTSL